VKLGTGGLSRAYRDTAAEALRGALIDDRFVYQRFRITVPFDQLGVVYRLIDAPHVLLAEEHFGETNEFDFDVRLSRAEEFAKTLVEKRLT
jgi:putative IMPACT (imprinted ancient) family translation regulator